MNDYVISMNADAFIAKGVAPALAPEIERFVERHHDHRYVVEVRALHSGFKVTCPKCGDERTF